MANGNLAPNLSSSPELDFLSGILQPSFILPGQRTRHQPEMEPERKLMVAVLVDAICCYLGERGRQPREEAEYWFAAGAGPDLFAFENLCDALGLHPQSVRRNLEQLRLDTQRSRRFPKAGRLRATASKT